MPAARLHSAKTSGFCSNSPGDQRSSTTSESKSYSAPPPQGFKKYQRSDIRLEVGQTTSIDLELAVGGLEEAVTVTAESPLVDTTTKEIGGKMNAQELADVPSFNRNFAEMWRLQQQQQEKAAEAASAGSPVPAPGL